MYKIIVYVQTGRVDYINENDRKLEEDSSGHGSEWYPDGEPEIDIIDLDDVDAIAEAARLLRDYGTISTDDAPSFYDPDGKQVIDYGSGLESETSAVLEGFSPSELDQVCEILESR